MPKSEQPARLEAFDPNKVSVAYQVVYFGPSDYQETKEDKEELLRVLHSFQSTLDRNRNVIKIQPSFVLGLFQVWTRTRESAESLPWSHAGYERRYEVLELPQP